MADTSLADKLKLWRSLVDGMKGRLEEVSHLKEDHAELGGLVQEIDGLLTQSDQHEARLRESTRRRTTAEDRAAELFGRVVAALRAKYGKRSPLLHEFGLRPNALPGERKKPDETKPPVLPEPIPGT